MFSPPTVEGRHIAGEVTEPSITREAIEDTTFISVQPTGPDFITRGPIIDFITSGTGEDFTLERDGSGVRPLSGPEFLIIFIGGSTTRHWVTNSWQPQCPPTQNPQPLQQPRKTSRLQPINLLKRPLNKMNQCRPDSQATRSRSTSLTMRVGVLTGETGEGR